MSFTIANFTILYKRRKLEILLSLCLCPITIERNKEKCYTFKIFSFKITDHYQHSMTKQAFLRNATVTIIGVLLGASVAFGATYQPDSVFISPEKEAPMPFTGLAVTWEEEEPAGTSAELLVRFYSDNEWSDWNELEHDIDGSPDQHNPEAFISTNLATKYQYKVILESQDPEVTPAIRNPEFTYIKAHEDTLEASIMPVESSFLASTSTKPALRVISRSEWGADEGLRVYTGDRPEPELVKLDDDFYEKYADELRLSSTVATNSDGQKLTWPLQYPEKVSKIIIHHTATSNNLDNPRQALRDIYYWHTISRGWGDIGYNYIIDQQGNIYEGRYGGDGVVGAHAGPANVGSIGIAVLGNYEENEVPEPVISSLTALIKAKATKYGIDTMGTSMFRGENSPNVMGHRDVMSTSCPGGNLYDLLPTIKALSKGAFTATMIDQRRGDKTLYNYDMAEDVGVFEMNGGEKTTLSLKVKNTGTQAWGADTYFMLSNTKSTQKYLSAARTTWKSAIAGDSVQPGETVTFQIPLTPAYFGGFTTFEAFPMIDGTTKLEKYISVPVQIQGAYYDYGAVNIDVPKKILKSGEKMEVTISMENTGDTPWQRSGENKVTLGTENPRDHISRVLEEPGARLADLNERSVEPGETGTFTVNIVGPDRGGYYREYFAPVIEGTTWLPHRDNYIDFYVADSSYGAKYRGTFFNQAFKPGEKKTVTLEFENTGASTLEKDGVSAFRLVLAKNSSLSVTGVELQEEEVATGETAHVDMTIEAPNEIGVYRVVATPKAGAETLTLRPVPMYIRVTRQPIQESTQVSNDVTDGFSGEATTTIDHEQVSTTTPITSTDSIRIGIGFEGNPVISANGPFYVMDAGLSLGTYQANDKLAVTYESGKYKVAGPGSSFELNNPPRFQSSGGSIMRIDNYENRPAWNDSYNDNLYRGALEVHWYDGKLVVVNELPLEDYLKGLAEIDAKQHFEKIKSIIVLARSYAKYYMTQAEKFPGAPFNLTDDPQRSQFYLGYGFEARNPTGVKAVEATSGIVVTYNGKVIKTPYFSSSDGRTRSAEEVWGWTDTPYLQSVDDPGCEGQELRGHGVGLSGCGALYWAEQGWPYDKIIKYYFQGVEVEKR